MTETTAQSYDPSPSRVRRFLQGPLPVYVLFAIAFPLAMAWVVTHELHGPTVCLFRQMTHLDCPGCGLTRAFRAMGRLDVVGAFRYNPLGPGVFLVTVLYWLYAVAMVATGGRVRLPAWWERHNGRLLLWGLVIFLLVGFIRIGYELRHPPAEPVAPANGVVILWPGITLPRSTQ